MPNLADPEIIRINTCETQEPLPILANPLKIEVQRVCQIWRTRQNYARGGLGLQLEGFYKKKAEENLKFGGRPKESEKDLLKSTNLLKPEIKKVDTREEISKVSGISHDTVSKIKEIKTSAPAESTF